MIKRFDWNWLNWPAIRAWLKDDNKIDRVVATIGYGGEGEPVGLESPATLATIMDGLGITMLVDVRAQPGGARIRKGWTQSLVKEAVGEERYVWRGGDLGGKDRHRGRGCTDAGLTWLDMEARGKNMLLLCACSDRATCHIHRLIATDLLDPERREAMKLPKRAPMFLHLWGTGCFSDGLDMFAETDVGDEVSYHTLEALGGKAGKLADAWRETYIDAEEYDDGLVEA